MGIVSAPKSTSARAPEMALLVQRGWKAKRSKDSKGPQAISPGKKLLTVPNPKEKPTYSPLLSKRLHKRVWLKIEIPPRKPFPPPLVKNPTPRPPPRSTGRLYARPYARPPARAHPYKRPESNICMLRPLAGP